MQQPNRPAAALALRYSLGLPGVSLAVVGMKSPQEIDDVIANAAAARPLDERELERLVEGVRPLVEKDAEDNSNGKSALFWLHDTKVMGWREHDEPALVAY